MQTNFNTNPTNMNMASSNSLEEILKRQKAIVKAKLEARLKAEAAKKAYEEEQIRKQEEKVESILSMDIPVDWTNAFESDEASSTIHAESVGDGLIYSIKNLGHVDIEYISKITNLDMPTVIKRLKGSIYQNPCKFDETFYKGYETADEYLSGNLLTKLHEAKEANLIYHGLFDDNIKALLEVMPHGVSIEEIYYSLSSPWIPESLIRGFISNIFRLKDCMYYVNHDTVTGTWELRISSFYTSRNVDLKYGTSYICASKVLERILNCRDMSIYDTLKGVDGKKKRRLNKAETILAESKATLLQEAFKNFIEDNEENKRTLTEAYNSHYGYNVARIYNGSYLEFPNMNKDVTLFDYQKNAISRIILNDNSLIAHIVGSGKTYEMIAAGEELLRCNISSKNLYVVPNNIICQWESDYKYLYPNANLLVCKPSDFSPAMKSDTLALIKNGGYNAVIMCYSSFDSIPLSKGNEIEMIKKKLDEIAKAKDAKQNTTALYKLRIKLEARLKELESEVEPSTLYFDDLGFTRLFVDEAHNYKNMPLQTRIKSIVGINPTGSNKCDHMLKVCDYMARVKGGVIFATGTPITNSISDVYVMQRYLQPGELKLLDINSFDAWVSMFAESKEEFEVDVDASGFRVTTRFAKFHNLPELATIFAHVADFYFDNKDTIPEFNGYTDILVNKTLELDLYLADISKRVDLIRRGLVNREDDNMLKITTDGKKAALDLRIIDQEKYINLVGAKAMAVSENVANIYYETNSTKSVQIIFCDESTPKDGFNMYDEVKGILVNLGIPANEIAFVHDATTDKARASLFSKMRKGDVRVAIGSTFKLGLGVNVQERLVAIHHLSVPWRPCDMVQREGRILRQGNTSDNVYIYRYITKGSFDAYSWQILETKQNFINELLSNSLNTRTKEDIENTVLNYGEVKALAIGNNLLKERFDLSNRLNKLLMLQKRERDRENNFKKTLLEIPSKRTDLENRIVNMKKDIALYDDNKREYSESARLSLRKQIWFGLIDHIQAKNEEYITIYQGFEIIAPAHLIINGLSLKIKANGSYIIDIGSSEIGCIVRVDNFLNSLNDRLVKLEEELNTLNNEEIVIKSELERKKDYLDEIESINRRLANIEKELKKK